MNGDLRRRIGLVTQDVQLFQASVRDNLTFFDTSIPDEQIHAVIEELELGDWYDSLSDGLDTKLETGGRGLSAGEAQLLAFTRVFLRDPGLVILDEASSRLDPATEQRIERAVDNLTEKLIEEFIVVALVCLVFLFHLRSAFVAIITLPLGILAAFIVMQQQGINANIMSLGGIAIAIGAMVDAAIVMIENAHKHLERFEAEHGHRPAGEEHWRVIAEAAANPDKTPAESDAISEYSDRVNRAGKLLEKVVGIGAV